MPWLRSQSRARSSQGAVLDAFSPREVQARIRAGASVGDVVAQTGWDQDKVLRYAEPVLGERAYVATRARAVEVRRSGGGATLAETAHAALGLAADDESIDWDALRREDGRWIVTGSRGGVCASWTYDSVGNTVHPLDDDARAWMGVAPAVDPIEDALGLIAETPVVRADAEVETIEPEPVPERPRLVAVPALDEEPADLGPSEPSGLDQSVPEPVAHPSTHAQSAEQTVVIAVERETFEEVELVVTRSQATEPEELPAAPKARKPKSRRSRASVPSWDEILFGTPKDDGSA